MDAVRRDINGVQGLKHHEVHACQRDDRSCIAGPVLPLQAREEVWDVTRLDLVQLFTRRLEEVLLNGLYGGFVCFEEVAGHFPESVVAPALGWDFGQVGYEGGQGEYGLDFGQGLESGENLEFGESYCDFWFVVRVGELVRVFFVQFGGEFFVGM